ncbi:MAG: shikimate kinase [Rhodospirillales bacterium]|nr:shikimate kinase [Rhodospirillales bacterium]|tara:strand:- start:1009 stop:1584 length:576 start_codon:yes stop_codon:yes gene_type:complete
MNQHKSQTKSDAARQFIVLVGLMGSGKTSIGRRIAGASGLPFVDTDDEVEKAAGCTIPKIFSRFGEQEFRNGERRVIARILAGQPSVIASGGGSFIDGQTRAAIKKHGVCIWLRADLDTLVKRTQRKNNRPLLQNGDPREILRRLMEERYPIYGEADIIIDVGDELADHTAKRAMKLIDEFRKQDAAASVK